MNRLRYFLILPWLVASFSVDRAVAEEASLFRDQVVPIFQKHCFRCHNDIDRKSDFSLQTEKQLRESGHVEAGKPGESALLTVLLPDGNEPAAMPKGGKPLSQEEIAVIRKWISAGAKWPAKFEIAAAKVTNRDWWSFRALSRPTVPVVPTDDRFAIRNPIDAFVLARIRKQGLKPSGLADRRALIRRLYFDLIGLPPSPQAVRQFIADRDPRAYEKLVDRLLASPRYGERWARHWLDIVKYADTCGYDKDKLRPNSWPYRDYVIRSFNTDKPYSRFVREQIAGDILFPGTADGILGLGFVAAGPWDFIGHVEVPETKIDGRIARHIDRDEMVSNTLNTFNSMTVQCCRCHNHKFDPFTQQHYYNLQSVFAAVDRAERPYDVDATIQRQRRDLAQKKAGLTTRLADLAGKIRKDGGPALVALQKKIAALRAKAAPLSKKPEFGYHSQIVGRPDQVKWVQIDLGKEIEADTIVLRPCHDEFGNIGAGFGFPVRFRVEASRTDATFKSTSDRIVLADNTGSDLPNPGLAPFRVPTQGKRFRYLRVTATKLVRHNNHMLALAELQVVRRGKNLARGAPVTALDSIQAPVRWARKNLTDGIWAKAGSPKIQADLAAAQKQLNELMARIETPARQAQRESLGKQLAAVNKQLAALPQGLMVYAASTHFKQQGGFKPTMGKPRSVRVLHRGNILKPLKPATPGTLPIFPAESDLFQLPANHSEGDRRVALANWITRRDHPLTWRSIVNRIWLYHFGQGLVSSPNDFGRMGQLPSHPQLLDWLAVEFRDGGQSFKKLHRMIVTSSVYRQASLNHAENARKDGGNRYLWRMNRRRLEAEEIRDSILSVSGRLNQRMGGPGYYLFKIERPEHSPHYEYHKHDPNDVASQRRAVYRFIVRSQPDPFMTTLDCADSSQSTPARDETTTSLQALSLLNNRFNLAMAKHFAARLRTQQDQLREQVGLAFSLVVGREPSRPEHQRLSAYAGKHGLENLCRLLFNLSEFVYLD